MSNPMNLTIPTTGSTTGPDYADQVNNSLTLIGEHTHVSGEGNPVPTAGLDINADLPLNGYNATMGRSFRFSEQSSTLLAGTDVGCLYDVLGDLYWNNASGTPIKITSGNALNASMVGGFTGLAGTTGAATYNNGTGAFTFTSDTNEKAPLKAGPLSIADAAASANSVTIKSPAALASNYDVTLPAALPAGDRILQMTSAGVIKNSLNVDGISLEISGTSIQTKVTPVVQTTASGLTNGQSTTYADVTNATVSLTSYGRPILIFGQSSGGIGALSVSTTTAAAGALSLQLDVTGSATASLPICKVDTQSGAVSYGTPSAVYYLYSVGAGTYTFKIQYKISGADTANTYANITNFKMVAVEM